jgi:lysophospholipase L1-like esterase
LIVLMFGANEGHNEFLELDEYREHLTQVIRTMRDGLPNADFLVIGPLDQASRRSNGELKSRRMPAKLNRMQRKVALSEGCAFFDTYTAMGGKNSMASWLKRGWGGGDLIHPTETGARRIGSWITDALLAGYEQFLYGDTQCGSNVTSL